MLSEKFLEKATEAVIDIAGLDSAQVFRFQNEGWTKCAYSGMADSDASTNSVLDELLRTRRTTTFHPEPNPQVLNSYEAIVASPILAPDGSIVGALYAGRNRQQKDGLIAPRINKLQASITELLARSVAAGWAWRAKIDELNS